MTTVRGSTEEPPQRNPVADNFELATLDLPTPAPARFR